MAFALTEPDACDGMVNARARRSRLQGYVVLFFAFFYISTALILTFKKYQLR